jgi:serine kinase of HPr protein (carbohydrate metabolism regulator)
VKPDGRIVALCGASQAGKTTIAVGLSRTGCRLWADDTVAFEATPDGLTALRLPFALNLRAKSAAFFDALTEGAAGHTNGQPPEWATARLAAFCVLERLDEAREPYVIERLSSSEAFIALLGQAFRFVPQANDEKRRMMRDYLEAVVQLPVFRLRYRTGFEILPEVIEQIDEVVLRDVAARE